MTVVVSVLVLVDVVVSPMWFVWVIVVVVVTVVVVDTVSPSGSSSGSSASTVSNEILAIAGESCEGYITSVDGGAEPPDSDSDITLDSD